jgi:NAD(P)-dependent dehydrogenase (short-subunit alcohol dehydrogenase family)
MANSASESVKVLITGGTSGLGLRLVKLFLKKGYEVVTTGRQPVTIYEGAERFTFLMTDFSNLRQTSDAAKKLCRNFKFDIVINNAGILSPPDFLLTDDGFEYTFQVNFLSHLLLNEIVLSNARPGQPIKIVTVTSPVYRIAETQLKIHASASDYRPLKAYANSKFYLGLMCIHLPGRYPSMNLKCIGFDPGIFSSGIYRMQRKWFRVMYMVGAPFMKRPEKTADRIGEILEAEDLINGTIYKSINRKKTIPIVENKAAFIFWQESYEVIEPFLT